MTTTRASYVKPQSLPPRIANTSNSVADLRVSAPAGTAPNEK